MGTSTLPKCLHYKLSILNSHMVSRVIALFILFGLIVAISWHYYASAKTCFTMFYTLVVFAFRYEYVIVKLEEEQEKQGK